MEVWAKILVKVVSAANTSCGVWYSWLVGVYRGWRLLSVMEGLGLVAFYFISVVIDECV